MFAAEMRQLRTVDFYQGLHIVTFGRLYRRSSRCDDGGINGDGTAFPVESFNVASK